MKKIRTGIALLLIMAAVSGCLFEPIIDPSSQPESSATASSGISEESAEPVSESSEESSESSVEVIVEEPDPFVGAPIPENTAAAEMNWLDDAVFIGDSLTYGLSAYEILPADQVLAHTGINPQTILTSACIETENGTKTVLEVLAEKTPGKIYIMLGANGVAFLSSDTVVDCYGQLIDGIRELFPDTAIYLQSILPVTAEKSSDPAYANSKIDQYNAAIEALAVEKEIYYVNVAEALKDENGNLPSDLSSDGMHFGPTIYQMWLDYLLRHRAEE